MAVDSICEHIHIVEGAAGPRARIVGSRVRVQDVAIWHEQMGMSVDEIVEEYPQLTRGDVYAALAYYWDHRDEIERQMEAEERFVEEYIRTHPGTLQERVRQLQYG